MMRGANNNKNNKREELLKCLKDGHCIGAARLLSVEEPLFVRKHCRSLMTYLI